MGDLGAQLSRRFQSVLPDVGGAEIQGEHELAVVFGRSQLGLVARYGLSPLLEAVTHADTAAAVLFLIAGDSTTGFAVNHALTVPGVLPSHCSRLSSAWLHAEPDGGRQRAPLQRVGGA